MRKILLVLAVLLSPLMTGCTIHTDAEVEYRGRVNGHPGPYAYKFPKKKHVWRVRYCDGVDFRLLHPSNSPLELLCFYEGVHAIKKSHCWYQYYGTRHHHPGWRCEPIRFDRYQSSPYGYDYPRERRWLKRTLGGAKTFTWGG